MLLQLETESGLEQNDAQLDQIIEINDQANLQLSCECKGDDDKTAEGKPVCGCPKPESNDEDQVSPSETVYRPAAAVTPHNELYREYGHGIIPGEKALKDAGLPTTTPEEKEAIDVYKFNHHKEAIPESLAKGAVAYKEELKKEIVADAGKPLDSIPKSQLPPEL